MDNIETKREASSKESSMIDESSNIGWFIHFNRARPEDFSEQSSIIDENKINNDRLAALQQRFSLEIVNTILEDDFEYGMDTQADTLVRKQMELNSVATKSWLNALFLDNYSTPSIVIGILRIIARIDYLTIKPEGPTMALAALGHCDTQVKECGVRAFESWSSKESLEVLENTQVKSGWLQEYISQVVDDLREELNDTSR